MRVVEEEEKWERWKKWKRRMSDSRGEEGGRSRGGGMPP